MTPFQLLAVALFAVALLAAYGKDIIEKARALLKRVPTVVPAPVKPGPAHSQELVSDLVTVSELRDRLAAQGCKDGADACTLLLRILVEFRPVA